MLAIFMAGGSHPGSPDPSKARGAHRWVVGSEFKEEVAGSMFASTGPRGTPTRGSELWPFARLWRGCIAFVLLVLCYSTPAVAASEEAALWRALASKGHVALLRHAIAPGTGDPPDFAVGDCSTQRNLSTEGRAQAKRIGARFRDNEIEKARVISSQWCRCLDTAELLGLGAVEELPLLNSFYQRTERRKPQTEALNKWLAGQELISPLVLVTHQVNISALTGVYVASGELVIIRIAKNGEIEVLGSIETD
jgi:phosphohistidine phosphatase SixA